MDHSHSLPLNTTIHLDQQLELLMKYTEEVNREIYQLNKDVGNCAVQHHDCLKMTAQLQYMQNHDTLNSDIEEMTRKTNSLETFFAEQASVVVQSHSAIVNKLSSIVTSIDHVQTRVLNVELVEWKREQQLHCNGADMRSSLDKIQTWCEKLIDIILLMKQMVKEEEGLKLKLSLHSPDVTEFSSQLQSKITQILSSLVTSTCVIEKQPFQVIKTNSKVTATVRFLVGKKLGLHLNPPKVTASILNEMQANALLQGNLNFVYESSGELLNNTELMQFNDTTRQLCVNFTKMQLKRIKRSEKKGTECVMDEKFSLLFQSQFTVIDNLVFQVWTFSLPVVVVVHGSQDPYAWATITWDNAFSDSGRRPFDVPGREYWPQIAETLNMKFRAAAGAALNNEALVFLAQKAFRNQCDDYNGKILSFTKFCKDLLPERNFTFWEWFYAAMKLTREHLRELWKEGLIMGFIMKKRAEEILASCPKGTFLLRFSDSELGGITIAWVGEHKEVYMLQPFTNKDFAIRSLPDRICDLHHLHYLYSGIPKDQAFRKFYTPFTDDPSASSNGYVKPYLVTHVPGLNDSNSLNCSNSSQLLPYLPEMGNASFTNQPHKSIHE